eukprot:729356-Alexandrium_andersonii.AAC.1
MAGLVQAALWQLSVSAGTERAEVRPVVAEGKQAALYALTRLPARHSARRPSAGLSPFPSLASLRTVG